ncbi:molybdopterin molybdotransferase MoeA [Dinghuibacter silviterrae]|uniref:Molybdopterin molybdenumtransferase n=1 Tax=Dinghuibacter silviterrae TaxID=1539049 RepID=A0A4R8DSJ4_9BACT|nr:gephyrin-like molybdotransferase Glp [Dinghuibacter silviterrae]TDX01234.1 molybdopterin molybdotransferase [Dinghuibacter silviterrae]
MISVDEAIELIAQNVYRLPATALPLTAAAGKVLASDIHATADMPAWPQAAMDGYAFAWGEPVHDVVGTTGVAPQDAVGAARRDTAGAASGAARDLLLSGEVPAGTVPAFPLLPGQAARIFTGAMLPTGADTIVIQEKVTLTGNRVRFDDPALRPGANVRPRGSEIPAGALALSMGTLLSPASVGFLASLGLDHLPVTPHPRIGLVTTGNELQTPGRPLGPGQVYESNSFALRAALEQCGLRLDTHRLAPDDPAELRQIIRETLDASDMLLLTGGVSVGAYDFVSAALAACGVRPVFHKVRQRPGKPLYFGEAEGKPVFGLPGNPSSVLTCFYIYVLPAIERMSGRPQSRVTRTRLPLEAGYRKAAGLTHFLKGAVGATGVTPLGAQESYRMSTYALANSLIRLPEEGTAFDAGDLVDVYLLPYL